MSIFDPTKTNVLMAYRNRIEPKGDILCKKQNKLDYIINIM